LVTGTGNSPNGKSPIEVKPKEGFVLLSSTQLPVEEQIIEFGKAGESDDSERSFTYSGRLVRIPHVTV
jgi:hypothetical protein